MSEPTLIDLPVGLRWIKLVCRLGRLVTDSAADENAYPDLIPVGGKLTLAATPNRVRIKEADGRWRSVDVAGRAYTIRSDGELVDEEGRVGVYIPDPASPLVEPQNYTIGAAVKPTGGAEWRVTISGSDLLPDVVDLVAVSSVGTASPSVTASFDARLYALETGGGVDVSQIVEDYLTANPPSGGSGGYPVQHVALTSAYTLAPSPSWPTDATVTVVFTQPAAGGRTVSYAQVIDGGQAPVRTGPNEITIVELWPIGSGRWRAYSDLIDGAGPVDPPADTAAPVWDATITFGAPTATSVVVTPSEMATDDVAVTGYEVSYDGGTTWTPITPGMDWGFQLMGTGGTTYSQTRLRALDAAGNRSPALQVPTYTLLAEAARMAWDDFDRADADELGTAPSGQVWEQLGDGTMGIEGGVAKRTTANPTTGLAVIDVSTTDAAVSVVWDGPAGSQRCPCARVVDDNNMYMVNSQSAGNNARIQRVIDGSVAALGTIGIFEPGDAITLEVMEEAEGTRVRGFLNGVQKVDTVDDTEGRPNGTRFGIRSAVPSLTFSDFEIRTPTP